MKGFTNTVISILGLLSVAGLLFFQWQEVVDIWRNGGILGYFFVFVLALLSLFLILVFVFNVRRGD